MNTVHGYRYHQRQKIPVDVCKCDLFARHDKCSHTPVEVCTVAHKTKSSVSVFIVGQFFVLPVRAHPHPVSGQAHSLKKPDAIISRPMSRSIPPGSQIPQFILIQRFGQPRHGYTARHWREFPAPANWWRASFVTAINFHSADRHRFFARTDPRVCCHHKKSRLHPDSTAFTSKLLVVSGALWCWSVCIGLSLATG